MNEPDGRRDAGPLLDRATSICAQAFGARVALRLIDEVINESGYRHAILRCAVDGAAPRAPPTIVIKASNRGGGHIVTEWAALELLARIDDAHGIAPVCYGGAVDPELLVLEDLGPVLDMRLRQVLDGDDSARAEEALLETAALLGRLHVATHGRRDAYVATLARLPAPAPLDFHQVGTLMDALRTLPDTLGAGVRDEVDRAMDALESRPETHVLTHGDVCPSNVAFTPAGARLLDFEVSGFRHRAVDAAYMRMRHLNCLDGNRIPPGVQALMQATYDATLADAGVPPIPADERAAGCMAWMAVMLTNLDRVRDKDRPRGPASYRQRILSALDEFARLSRDEHTCPAVATAVTQLLADLRAAWPDAVGETRPFAAFRDGRGTGFLVDDERPSG